MPNHEDSIQPCELPVGSLLLQGQYEIRQHLAVGGFGMTYLARDSLSRQVVVKECFPDGMCVRRGRLVLPDSESKQVAYQTIVWNFVAEARRLARLKHPNIVAVHQVFEENHTAYMAMDFVDGEELLDILENDPRRLTPELLETLLRDVLGAMQHLHEAGFLHRDISPDNLLLDSKNHLTLIDFGAARENAQNSTNANTFLLAVKDGYSPHEFYLEDAPQDASSDLYSLAATFYHLITGAAPADCWTRYEAIRAGGPDPFTPLSDGGWPFAPGFLALLDQALSVERAARPVSAAAWLEQLDAEQPPGPRQKGPDDPEDREQPLPPAELDLDAISELVEITNTGLAGNANTAPPPKQATPAEDVAAPGEAEKHPVDIFGNPIEDVEAWLREQDALARSRAAASIKAETIKADTPGEGHRKSLFRRILSAPLTRTRDTASTA